MLDCASKLCSAGFPTNHLLCQASSRWISCTFPFSMTPTYLSSYSQGSLSATSLTTSLHGTGRYSITTRTYGMHTARPLLVLCRISPRALGVHREILPRRLIQGTKLGNSSSTSTAHIMVLTYFHLSWENRQRESPL